MQIQPWAGWHCSAHINFAVTRAIAECTMMNSMAVASAHSALRDSLSRVQRAYKASCDSLKSSTFPQWRFATAAGIVMLLPLMLNGGYFSHDEFEWAAKAASPDGPTPLELWRDHQAFQYRPLAFSLWMLLSNIFFESPRLFHLAFALLGLINGLLLRALLRRHGVEDRFATLGMLLFLASPYTTFVNGWVATPEDQLWVAGGLLVALAVTMPSEGWKRLALICGLVATVTVAALFAKEAAVVLPGVLLTTWLFRRRPVLFWAGLASALPVVIYLVVRLDVILATPPNVAATYDWTPSLIPQRLAEYLSFPLAVPIRETSQLVLVSPSAFIALGAVTLAMVLALLAAAPRLGAWWLAAGTVSLAPVLILVSTSNQYGYGLAAITAGTLAVALPRARGIPRAILIGAVLLQAAHAGVIAKHMLDAGRVARNFVSATNAAVAQAEVVPVRLYLAEGVPSWRFTRLIQHHPVGGVPTEARLHFVHDRAFADYEVKGNGKLQLLFIE
jgi:hypothetical protein